MSKENLTKLVQASREDEQLAAKLQNAGSYEEIKGIAEEMNLPLGDLDAEEAQRAVGVLTGRITEELTEDELEMVAGGQGIGNPMDIKGDNVFGRQPAGYYKS